MDTNNKSETLNSKQYQNSNVQNSKQYNLEERTLKFTILIRDHIKNLPKTITNFEIGKQLFRSAGSVGANYIEANESLSKKDFIMRVKICRKEAKESIYWLRLADKYESNDIEKNILIGEATELMKIFGAIIQKCK